MGASMEEEEEECSSADASCLLALVFGLSVSSCWFGCCRRLVLMDLYRTMLCVASPPPPPPPPSSSSYIGLATLAASQPPVRWIDSANRGSSKVRSEGSLLLLRLLAFVFRATPPREEIEGLRGLETLMFFFVADVLLFLLFSSGEGGKGTINLAQRYCSTALHT